MEIVQAYKYELQPTKRQLVLFYKHAGTARFAYNWGLARKMEVYKETKKSLSAIDLHKEICLLKKTEFSWMYEVSKCAPSIALRNLDVAFKNFFRNIKHGKKPGFPKFKKRGIKDSFTLDGSLKITGRRKIKLPRLGSIRTKETTDKLKGRITSATVSREADRWFVSFTVQRTRMPEQNNSTEIVGVDLGLATFAMLSDGTKFNHPKPLKRLSDILKRRSRQHSKKQRGSNNKKKSALTLARLHRRIKNVRNDFIHKLTTFFAKTKQVIVIEDLHVKGMMRNHKLARSISDVGWSKFRALLEYKTLWYGSKLHIIDRFYASSKICSCCKHKKLTLDLSKRVYRCDNCDNVMDRDLNAAKNIKNLYMCTDSTTGSSPGSNACGEASSGLLEVQQTKLSSTKQELTETHLSTF